MLGNTITTWIGNDPTPVITTRNSGESDNDFIDRHCRAILARVHGSDTLKTDEVSVSLQRAPGQSDEAFVTAYDVALKAVA
jgi:hypothetical protein